MPPKCKFTKEEIILAALDMARSDGIDVITARALGTKLGSSPKPIFGFFENMDEVQKEVIIAAKQLYDKYVEEGLKQLDIPVFKGVGMQYIKFALQEPKLFQILFMSEQQTKPTVSNVLPTIDNNYSEILFSIEKYYELNKENAKELYRHLWIYTHGIAVLCATQMCVFTKEEMGKMLTEVCLSILNGIRGNKND